MKKLALLFKKITSKKRLEKGAPERPVKDTYAKISLYTTMF